MKPNEIKEINNSLPTHLQHCVLYLEEQVKKQSFTAWSLAIDEFLVSCYWADEALPLKSTHQNLYGFHPHFDLASLTKPLFVNTWLRSKWGESFQSLVSQQLSHFEWHQNDWNKGLIEFINKNSELTFDSFLSHKSHFKPWAWVKKYILLHNKSHFKENFLNFLLENYQESQEAAYSDLNYLFLILLIESLWSDLSWEHEVEHLNSIHQTHFFHAGIEPEKSKHAIPSFPYYIDSMSENHEKSKFFGVVHDTNANILASVPEEERIISGHAGLFGNVVDVFLGVDFLKKTQPEKLNSTLIDRYSYGLETRENALGHLGYTGTSCWFHPHSSSPHKSKKIILLTNRTSQRTTNITQNTPRVFTITNLNTKINTYFFFKNEKIVQCDEGDVIKKLNELFADLQISWDDSKIPKYENLSEVRKKIETEVW